MLFKPKYENWNSRCVAFVNAAIELIDILLTFRMEEKNNENDSKFDACLKSMIKGVGTWSLVGFIGSAAVRRRGPLVFGIGMGVGCGVGDCCNNGQLKEEKEEEENKDTSTK